MMSLPLWQSLEEVVAKAFVYHHPMEEEVLQKSGEEVVHQEQEEEVDLEHHHLVMGLAEEEANNEKNFMKQTKSYTVKFDEHFKNTSKHKLCEKSLTVIANSLTKN